eukprot:1145467-Pelagomonas_calceolata.AAC.3
MEHGHKVKYVNVMVPLIARMLRFFFSEARIPACWRVEKLSPLHKDGAVSNPGKCRMIAVSKVMYRICANAIKDPVADCCVHKKKQFLTPIKILLGKEHSTPFSLLHAAFIDFSRAYDTVPRLQLWDYLQCIAMPASLFWAIKGMYSDDKYVLIDGEREISEGVRGAMTGDGVNGVLYMLYADGLKLTTDDPGEMQVMLNMLQVCAKRKGLTVNT